MLFLPWILTGSKLFHKLLLCSEYYIQSIINSKVGNKLIPKLKCWIIKIILKIGIEQTQKMCML